MEASMECDALSPSDANVTNANMTPAPIRSRLMELPGEIREQIYEFVIACPSDCYECSFAGMAYAKRERRPPGDENKQRVSFILYPDCRAPAFSLLHVNRQLHAEFRYTYLKFPVRVHYNDAAAYMKAFYPLPSPFAYELKAFSPATRLSIEFSWASNTNIVPLLQHLYALPQIRFDFHLHGYPLENDTTAGMNEMFVNHAEAWRRYLGRFIGAVAFVQVVGQPLAYLAVYFKKHTPGMEGFSYLQWQKGDRLLEILAELGVKDVMKPRVLVRLFLGD